MGFVTQKISINAFVNAIKLMSVRQGCCVDAFVAFRQDDQASTSLDNDDDVSYDDDVSRELE